MYEERSLINIFFTTKQTFGKIYLLRSEGIPMPGPRMGMRGLRKENSYSIKI
jgi:hypothetical protein